MIAKFWKINSGECGILNSHRLSNTIMIWISFLKKIMEGPSDELLIGNPDLKIGEEIKK